MQDGEVGAKKYTYRETFHVYSERTAFAKTRGHPCSTCTTHDHQDQEEHDTVTRLGKARTEHYHILAKLAR